MLIALLATAMTPFTCHVIRVHDGDGPLWCRTGERIRIAGIQSPDFKSAAPCRRPARQRQAFRCDDRAAARSQRLVSALVLNKRIRCQPVDTSYNRIVARCTLPDGRSLSCAAIAAGAAVQWYHIGGRAAWVCASNTANIHSRPINHR